WGVLQVIIHLLLCFPHIEFPRQADKLPAGGGMAKTLSPPQDCAQLTPTHHLRAVKVGTCTGAYDHDRSKMVKRSRETHGNPLMKAIKKQKNVQVRSRQNRALALNVLMRCEEEEEEVD